MSRNPDSHKNDPQYKQAKQQGYRARSAYKLIEIQKRFSIFKRAFYILDIGSAPGSWLQVAKKYAQENIGKYNDQFYYRDTYKIMGVDVKKISPIDNIHITKMDITESKFKDEIVNYFQGEKLDLVLSDASINKSGNKYSDQARQVQLCYKILNYSEFLKYKGNFVVKLFQGEDFDKFYKTMKTKFMFVKSFKPYASYKKSNEIFIIGLKRK